MREPRIRRKTNRPQGRNHQDLGDEGSETSFPRLHGQPLLTVTRKGSQRFRTSVQLSGALASLEDGGLVKRCGLHTSPLVAGGVGRVLCDRRKLQVAMHTDLPFKRVLFLGAHTDDEFGCTGTLLRLLEAGAEVTYNVFSICEESVPDGLERDILSREVVEATKTIGLSPTRVHVGRYPVRHFPAVRQQILEELVRLGRELRPDLVLVPALSDIHQDHHVVAEEGLRAFKFSSVLGYELPMNSLTFSHACFVGLDERHLERKMSALRCYRSQAFRPYVSEDFVRGLARVRGVQAGTGFAEAFEVLRMTF